MFIFDNILNIHFNFLSNFMSNIQQISNTENREIKKDFFKQIVEHTHIIGNEVSKALNSVREINSRTNMLSITAKIEASRTGDVGRNFLVVSNSIDELSTRTDKIIEKMERETIQGINNLASVIENKSITVNGNRLSNLALTNIRLVDRNLFERAADIRWWATDGIILKSMSDNNDEGYIDAENRLSVMLKSYSVYHDLILCDISGQCKATGENKLGLKGRDFSNKSWFKNAINTKDGTDYGFSSVNYSTTIDDHTVVFSCKVHEDGDTQKKVIGVLAAVFKWTEFAQRIVNETSLTNDEKPNTRVLICDDSGYIFADTQKKILDQIDFKDKSNLFSKEKGFTVQEKNEKIQLISHALSPGFEGYKSTGWHSLIIQDLDVQSYDVDSNASQDKDESLDSVTKLVVELSDETLKATEEINKINDQTHILSLNAAIEAAKVGNDGKGFGVISGFMGDLSRNTADITSTMSTNTQEEIKNLYDYILTNSKQIKGDRLASLSLTNIDLVDRALYERSADVRWWATVPSMVKSLVLKTKESADFLKTRLDTILRYYTVYDELIVADNEGVVIANSSTQNQHLANVLNQNWFKNAKKTKNGQEYSFDVIRTKEKGQDKVKLVLSCKIHNDGDFSREAIGVLAIVFKWEQFAKTIFDETPLNDSEKAITSMVITDKNCDFLAAIDKDNGMITNKELLPLFKEAKNFDSISKNENTWLAGHAASVGYEGFSTGWHALIVQKNVK